MFLHGTLGQLYQEINLNNFILQITYVLSLNIRSRRANGKLTGRRYNNTDII